jgi:hypothetical protein
MSENSHELSNHYREGAQKARKALQEALADMDRERLAFQLEMLRDKQLEREAIRELLLKERELQEQAVREALEQEARSADPWANGIPERDL